MTSLLCRQVPTEESLHARLQNFIRSRPSLHQTILLYQPIWLSQFIKDVKEVGTYQIFGGYYPEPPLPPPDHPPLPAHLAQPVHQGCQGGRNIPDIWGSITEGTLDACGKDLCSVADPDPGCYPGSEFFPSRIRIEEFKYFYPKKVFLSSLNFNMIQVVHPDPDPDFLPIPDPGVKRHRIPDPDPQHWIFGVYKAGGDVNRQTEKMQLYMSQVSR